MGVVAPVSVRVNPDVDARTHPYISTGLRENKFGVSVEEALLVYQRAAGLSHVAVVGLDCHIGSQLTELSPFLDALRRLLALIDTLEGIGISIRHLDLGGGLGVRYRDETPPSIAEYIAAIRRELGSRPLALMFEPGRSIAANAGLLVTRVEYLKPTSERNFALVDAAMNDMIRPALYQAWLDIQPVEQHGGAANRALGCGGPGLRDRRFPRQGPRAEHCPRGPAGSVWRRRLRFQHEFELQQPRPRPGVDGRSGPRSPGARAGDYC